MLIWKSGLIQNWSNDLITLQLLLLNCCRQFVSWQKITPPPPSLQLLNNICLMGRSLFGTDLIFNLEILNYSRNFLYAQRNVGPPWLHIAFGPSALPQDRIETRFTFKVGSSDWNSSWTLFSPKHGENVRNYWNIYNLWTSPGLLSVVTWRLMLVPGDSRPVWKVGNLSPSLACGKKNIMLNR